MHFFGWIISLILIAFAIATGVGIAPVTAASTTIIVVAGLALAALLLVSLSLRTHVLTVATIAGVFAYLHIAGIYSLTWQVVAVAIPIYILIGLVYSYNVWKAWLRSSAAINQRDKAYAEYKRSGLATTGVEFAQSIYYPYGFKKDFSRISNYAVFWPFHLTGNLFTGVELVIRQSVTALGRAVSDIYAREALKVTNQHISDKK